MFPTSSTELIDLSLDFETFYSVEYSLSRMTTLQYVLGDEYETIGVGLKFNDTPSKWYTGSEEYFQALFDKIPWHRVRLIGHNLLFDAAILYWRYGKTPAAFFCTMQGARKDIVPWSKSMSLAKISTYLEIGVKGTEVVQAKGKHLADFTPYELAKYGDYCNQDTELCYLIYQHLKPKFSAEETMMLHLTIRKGVVPQARWNRAVLEDALLNEQIEKAKLIKEVGNDAKQLGSNPQFAELLRAEGVEPPRKISPTTGKDTFAFAKTDLGFQALQEHPNRRVRALVAARLGVKSTLMETRIGRLLEIEDATGGYATFPLLYYGAHTGRLSGMDKINMQNPPQGSAIRLALEAINGYTMLAADLSQVEARIVAWLADQLDLVEQFRRGEDVYCNFASVLYGKTVTKKNNPKERFVGKTCILGLGFQLGGDNFAIQCQSKGIDMPREEGIKTVNLYRQTYPKIKQLWWRLNDMLKEACGGRSTAYKGIMLVAHDKGATCYLPGGRYIEYPQLMMDTSGEMWYRNNKGKMTKVYGGKFTENVVQALAQTIIRDIELTLAHKEVYALGQVHDELIFAVKSAAADKFKVILEKVFCVAAEWASEIPLACEVEVGPNYLECK